MNRDAATGRARIPRLVRAMRSHASLILAAVVAGVLAWPGTSAARPPGRTGARAGSPSAARAATRALTATRALGALVFSRGLRSTSVWVAAADGASARRVAAGEDPQISADGRLIAYRSRCHGSSCEQDLMLMPAAGGGRPRTLAHGLQWPFSFSPDSRTIAAVLGTPGGRERLVVIDLQTGVRRTIATGCSGCFGGLSFAPDGGQLVYALASSQKTVPYGDLYRVAVAGGAPFVVTHDRRALDPLWGPGGRIVFARRISGTRATLSQELYLIDPEGRHLRRLTYTHINPAIVPLMTGLQPTAWSASGRRLLAEFTGTDTSYAVTVNVRTGAERTVPGNVVGTALSADGSTILGEIGGVEGESLGNVVSVPYNGGLIRVLARNAGAPDWNR